MLVITVLITLGLLANIIMMNRQAHWSGLIITIEIAFMLLLLSETIFYWVKRKAIVHRWLARGHVYCIFFGFLVVPAFLVFSDYYALASRASRVHWEYAACWGLFLLGHVFFVSALVKMFTEKRLPPAEDANNVNLLDDVFN